MNVLHHHLEAVEGAGFGNLNLRRESLGQILKHDSIGGGKEGKNMLQEVLLIRLKGRPVLFVLSKVDFVDCPKAGHLVFVHLPYIVVLDGQDNKSVGVLFQKGLILDVLGLGTIFLGHLRVDHSLGEYNFLVVPTIASVALLNYLRLGLLGRRCLGLREPFCNCKVLVLTYGQEFGNLGLDSVFCRNCGHQIGS